MKNQTPTQVPATCQYDVQDVCWRPWPCFQCPIVADANIHPGEFMVQALPKKITTNCHGGAA